MPEQQREVILCWMTVPFIILFMISTAFAQQSTFRNSNGQVTGRAVTNSMGTQYYDASGRNTGRSTTNSTGVTTIYNERGQVQGTIRSNK
jgi:hypothetical protein